MSGGFNVTADELRAHAGTVNSVATSVDSAAEAAQTEQGGGLVFGVLFDALTWGALNLWAQSMADSFSQSAEIARSISGGLLVNADCYDECENATKQKITSAGNGGS